MDNENVSMGTGYTTYQNMVSQVSQSLLELEKICRRLKLEENVKGIQRSKERLESHKFSVGVMGEFKRGKSTVINSMLEKEIMPSDILPCSATMNRVTYDLQPHVELKMMDGSVKNIAVDELAGYVTKLDSESESMAAQVNEAVVYYPCKFCQNGVDIVDTPGLNDDERMNKICEEIIPKLDAVIMVITPDNPFSMSEAEFVRNKLMASDLGRLIFLVNKMDTVRSEKDREKVLQGIKDKIKSSVLEKMAEMYGEASKEYEDTKLKLGNIRIYPFSALDALEGKMNGDSRLIEKSGTLPFEEALTYMLTEERGALELAMPINVIQKASVDAAKAAETRKKSLELSSEEFKKRQQEALQEIQAMREKKKNEKKRLSDRAVTVKKQLEAQVLSFYPELEEKLKQVIDNTSVDMKNLSNEAGQKAAAEKFKKAVSDEMEAQMSAMSEKLQVQLEEIVGKEAVRIGSFVEEISQKVDTLQVNISRGKKSFDATDLVGYGADVLFFGCMGIGGAMAGYKNAGVKGAVAGVGISWVSGAAVAGLLLSMSFAALPVLLISCAASNLAGKFFTKKLFSGEIARKRLEEMRSGIKTEIHKMIIDMQSQRELEKWVSELVEGRFSELINGMEEECERMLKDTENTMDSIKENLTENELSHKTIEKECDGIIAAIKKINTQLEPLNEKVRQVLESA